MSRRLDNLRALLGVRWQVRLESKFFFYLNIISIKHLLSSDLRAPSDLDSSVCLTYLNEFSSHQSSFCVSCKCRFPASGDRPRSLRLWYQLS